MAKTLTLDEQIASLHKAERKPDPLMAVTSSRLFYTVVSKPEDVFDWHEVENALMVEASIQHLSVTLPLTHGSELRDIREATAFVHLIMSVNNEPEFAFYYATMNANGLSTGGKFSSEFNMMGRQPFMLCYTYELGPTRIMDMRDGELLVSQHSFDTAY